MPLIYIIITFQVVYFFMKTPVMLRYNPESVAFIGFYTKSHLLNLIVDIVNL